jgi:hypothetical protein
MRVRGDEQGSLPWDEAKEGPERKLCEVLDEFLNDTFVRNRKGMFKNAILKVKSVNAVSAPARLQMLLKKRANR